MFLLYLGGILAVLLSVSLPVVGIWFSLKKRVSRVARAGLAPLAFLPLLIFGGDIGFRYLQHRNLKNRWSMVRPGMSVTEVEELLGPPDRVWGKGEAIHNLIFGWRNSRPMWEYKSPLGKCLLQLDSHAPYIRFRCGLDDLDFFGPSGLYLQVSDANTVHSVGRFTEADVQ